MNAQKNPPASAEPSRAASEVMTKQPKTELSGSVDFMGQPPYDARASIAAVRAYFAHAKKD